MHDILAPNVYQWRPKYKLSLYNHVPVVALPTDWISMSLRISKLGNSLNPKVWELFAFDNGQNSHIRESRGLPMGNFTEFFHSLGSIRTG